MQTYQILIMNGPNLGSLGVRQPHIYGTQSLADIPALVRQVMGAQADAVSLSFFQSNAEGALIDRFEKARTEKIHGVVLNAGAYTHTSLALADCLAWIELPVVEVHVTNVLARPEPIRRQSYIGAHVIGAIAGFGVISYALGVQALYAHCCTRQ